MDYFHRLIETRLQEDIDYFKVILLLGARQVGKSTLFKHLFPNYQRFVFDPVEDRYQVRMDPDLFLKSIKLPVIFDEIQYVPELLSSIKRFVDERDVKGQFLLTGSQNFSLLKNISESLAGRVGIFHLGVMTTLEQKTNVQKNKNFWLKSWLDQDIESLKNAQPIPNSSVHDMIWRGGYPELIKLPDSKIGGYLYSYIQTYIERDIRTIANITNLQLFGRFVQLQAACTAQEINHTKISRDLGLAMTTIQSWTSHLTGSYLWHEVPSFSGNMIRRVIRRAKGYFSDTGLACYLMRISSQEALLGHPSLGALFETLLVNEIKNISATFDQEPGFYHWRTNGGAEVDLILEYNGILFPIEFKCSTHAHKNDLHGINAFRKAYGDTYTIGAGLVVYAGDDFWPLGDNAYALPWNWMLL